MTQTELQQQALQNAQNSSAITNYPAIYAGFSAKGIPEDDIQPRVNILTFNAWKALGRSVRKGEHGVKVITYIPVGDKKNEDGETTEPGYRKPHSTTVFHISQTEVR